MRKQVAQEAGVSEATVSRVFSGSTPVQERTRQRVLDAAARLGYVPNELARQLARNRSGNLGVVLPVLPHVKLFSTHYFSEILGGIGAVARERGFDLLLVQHDPADPADHELLFRRRKVDALIVLGARGTADELEQVARLDAAELPFLLVNQRMPGFEHRTVEAAHRTGSRLAAEHLLAAGWRRLAFVNGPADYSNSLDRLRGFCDATGETPAGARVLEGTYSATSGRRLADDVAALLRAGTVDGVVAANDRMALGIQQGLRTHGLVAGTDYGLCGYDDSDGASLTEPALTSVAVPFFEMGRLAAELVLNDPLMQDAATPTTATVGDEGSLQLPVRLVVRRSSVRSDATTPTRTREGATTS